MLAEVIKPTAALPGLRYYVWEWAREGTSRRSSAFDVHWNICFETASAMQPIPESSPQFSNLQLELLRLYSRNISDEELLKIKDLLANFFAERAIAGANAWWDANNFTDADVERMLTTKMRARNSEENAALRH